MSDPEPSTAACSSPPPSAQAQTPDSAAALNYAFLVHSQKTLTQNLPPRVDNKLLARQKRRRTSPEDHAVLETEYQRNPKPDKAVRASIVSRVSLGEKEVQIWFQNRRQNDRRKSKPLQPHELLAPRSGVSDASKPGGSDEHLPAEPESSGTEQSEENGQDQLPATQLSDHASFEFDVQENRNELEQPVLSSQTSLAVSEPVEDSQGAPQETMPEHEPEPEPEASQLFEDESLQNSVKRKRSSSDNRGTRPSMPEASTPGTFQEVKSPPSLRISLSFDGEAMVRKEGELTPSPPKGRNALRIAMSSDGKAVIRADGEPSPSKNRISMFSARKPRFAGLRRSSSAVTFSTPRGGPTTESERLFGRSRDPRNWESFFDTDARSALSTPTSSQSAPNSGSPSLFRARGQRSLTRSLSAKHTHALHHSDYLNTPVPKPTGEKRRKLSRTVSSLGRLETGRVLGNRNPHATPNSKPYSTKDDGEMELHWGDSDKENWIPGTRVSHVRRRTASHHHSRRPVLKEANGGKPSREGGSSRHSRGSHAALPRAGGAKDAPEVDAEVSAFMNGGGSASQEEDLDCIQGLLSLSQGAWR